MPTLTLDVTDAVVARCRTAFGVANNAALKAAIIAKIKDHVVQYEADQATTTAQASVKTAQQTAEASINTAIATAQTDIVIT